MKLEYLSDARMGGTDGDLIRLFNFIPSEVTALMSVIQADLLTARRSLRLNGLPFIHALNCGLSFILSETDRGVLLKGPMEFFCELTEHGWLNALDLMKPFTHQETHGFQWLYDLGNARTELLLSTDGKW